MKKNSWILIFFLSTFIILGSCTTPKNVVYFQNVKKDNPIYGLVDNNFELKIRKNDLIGINIISPDPMTTPLFNGVQSAATSSTDLGGPVGSKDGYLVDNKGNITLYKLGAVHVEGLTRTQLKQKLQRDLSPYLKDAVISIRFLNNKVTMLGELARPQVLTMADDQLSIVEAIAQSGDLTFTGRRDNILVIRETAQGKEFARLNLTDNSIFTSPFFYLRPDDVVYVEPTEFKINSTAQTQQLVSYILSGVTILLTALTLLLR